MKRGMRKTAAACCIALMLLSGCGKTAGNVNSDTADSSEVTKQSGSEESAASQSDTDDIDSMFTDRDKEVGYDEEKCVAITLSDDGSSCDNTSVAIDGQTITITEEGTYLLSGSLSNGSVVVATDENVKVRLILNGVVINNDSSAAVYVQSADKVFITLAPDSENKLSNGGTYEAVDDNNIDSVIFSKSDLTLNGSGSLTITAKAGHGIVSKDDLVITGGILVAAGSSGMAVNFGDNSTQGSILVNLDRQEAGTDIVLTDASGTELINWQPSKQYTSVVISCPGIAQGESYTLKAGTSETTVTMDSLIYGTGNTMGR